MIEQVTSAATHISQLATASRQDAMPNTLPSKVPRYERSSSSHSVSGDTLTKHLTALWEREDSTVPMTSAAPVSRAGSKRKATSVSSYLSATKPDLSLPLADASNQLSTSTILSQLLSSCAGATSSPASISVVSSAASDRSQLTLQKNILLTHDRQSVAAAKQSSAVNVSNVPLRRLATEFASATNNIFRLPTYEQVIGNGAALSSPLIKAKPVANEVFPTSPQTGSSVSVGNAVSSVLTDVMSSVAGTGSMLLGQSPTTDSAAIASHMQLDDSELLRQLEQILSEPGLSLADIDSVFGGCLVVPPSLPQSLSAIDQKAISLIQSQLMSVEASSSSAVAVSSVSSQWKNGTLCQLLSGKSALTSNTLFSTDKSEIRSHGSLPLVNNQPLLSTAVVKSSCTGAGQYHCSMFTVSRCKLLLLLWVFFVKLPYFSCSV